MNNITSYIFLAYNEGLGKLILVFLFFFWGYLKLKW